LVRRFDFSSTGPYLFNQSVDGSLLSLAAKLVNHSVEDTMTRLAEDDRLDHVFHALANRTRRALLKELAAGPARVTELAKPHGMSVNAISKHLFVLEGAGLIRRERDCNIQSCVLDAAPMATADEWIQTYRSFWTQKFERLAKFMERPRK
jgi:DNA-binding transcriptional ArsR family regulator